ncbi:TIGR03826 family flagellar region protein [Bacillus tuaregi]|uniref:TIGR03826 family flagellar region protein n=1 Tax=Bacillus tuaregi TaxID=1816695 RepID=UPI000AFD47C9|nr:TIGR03826 family flagellar region protein [Bacillus tuaregi]
MMPDIDNCPKCGKIMIKSKFRDVCEACYKEEEKQYEIIYKFMRKRENRAATIKQIIDATGVEEDLLLKFIKNGRFQQTQFPNLGYPCEKCGKIIQSGKLCDSCAKELRTELSLFEKEETRKQELKERERQRTYLAVKKQDD